MPPTVIHNAIVLRPYPGGRFSIHGSDVELQFPRGQEREQYEWLLDWLESQVLPAVIRAEQGTIHANPEIAALQARIESGATYGNPAQQQGSPNTTPHNPASQKLAAMHVRPAPNHVHYDPNPHAGRPPAAPPVPGTPVVYGANGAMSPQEIQSLPDKPIPGVGYIAPASQVNPSMTAPSGAFQPTGETGSTEGNQ